MTHDFQPWPKIARLNRDITITEKIDGTNAAVGIEQIEPNLASAYFNGNGLVELDNLRRSNTAAIVVVPGEGLDELGFEKQGQLYWVWAQSRNRVITPGKSTDNAGFAGWVAEHAEIMVAQLGEGLHFGEWWGRGIQRGYDQPAKRFSLFNTHRYAGLEVDFGDDGTIMNTVPVLYQGPFGQFHIDHALDILHRKGSLAAGGFMNPEGIIVYHSAASTMFKVTLEGDESPKGLMQHG